MYGNERVVHHLLVEKPSGKYSIIILETNTILLTICYSRINFSRFMSAIFTTLEVLYLPNDEEKHHN